MKPYSIIDALDVERFGRALDMLDESIGELRRVAHHIMPELLVRDGLKSSLGNFCRTIPGIHFQCIGSDARLDSGLEILLYHCACELVYNAMKHAKATHIDVQLIIDKDLIALAVHDDGIGFDPETILPGSGISHIRSRVTAAKGKLSIYSSPGSGTEVTIEIEDEQA
jgi:signal transduction histidine kinase